MTADRGHLHHRLVDMGFSQKQTVFILYAISGVLGITAVLLAESGVLRALLLCDTRAYTSFDWKYAWKEQLCTSTSG